MRTLLKAEVDSQGHVCTHIPPELLWEFVEYLSFQRLNCHYHYDDTDFTVVFPNQSFPTVQRVIDDWSNTRAHDRHSAPLA